MSGVPGDLLEVALPGGGRAAFTTRAAGNLSLSAGIDHERGFAARERLCGALGLRWLCAGPQIHGTLVRRVWRAELRGGQPLPDAADGSATALPEVGVMALAADCVPIVLGAPGAVAAVHAGWRGLAAGVIEEGVLALREVSGSEEGEIAAVVGPCAGACCYEVGEEVQEAFQGAGRVGARILDLRRLARERLLSAGVAHVQDLDICTICDERLFSHRREGSAAGRQAAIAWLPR